MIWSKEIGEALEVMMEFAADSPWSGELAAS
jgi:hypothetical protein